MQYVCLQIFYIMKNSLIKSGLILFVFLAFYFFPFDEGDFEGPVMEAFLMLRYYSREHVILCMVPAFFIAGAISNFISQGAVLKYLGAKASKTVSYSVASVSGAILAVCSCTVLPLFAGIYKRGAGLGPAIAFLYSGPAVNILAIILTARVLGFGLGLARAIGAVIFSIIIGLFMHLIFIKEETARNKNIEMLIPGSDKGERSLIKTSLYIFSMVGILIFLNWGRDDTIQLWNYIYDHKLVITLFFALGLFFMLLFWFKKEELKSWLISTREFTEQIMPLLFFGVFFAGLLLGRPGNEGIIPSNWIIQLVGGNSIGSNFFASIAGAFMYFATLTEIPILEGLIGNGMGRGPALALLLAGPALSLPSMLAVRSVIGTKKTIVYIFFVIIMSTLMGLLYGSIAS